MATGTRPAWAVKYWRRSSGLLRLRSAAAAFQENRMEKCVNPNQRRRSCRTARLNPEIKNQLPSSLNCARALELIKPTVFKVAIKNKYEIGPTDRYPSLNSSHKPPPESSQLNRGKVAAWTNTTCIPAPIKVHDQCRPKTEIRKCPFRSTEPKSKTPAENGMSYITGKDSKSTKLDADDHLSSKEEIEAQTSCEIGASSRSLDLEFQQTEVNAREILHLYLPNLDIHEEEEFSTRWEPDEGVSQKSKVSAENMKIKGKYKNINKIQDSSGIKGSAWICRPGDELKGQVQRKPMCARKCVHPTSISCYFMEQKKYSETFQDPPNGLNRAQPLKHNSRNDSMAELNIYDLETELDDAHRPQENTHNSSPSNTNENPTLVTDAENDREKTKIFVFNATEPKEFVMNVLPMAKHLNIQRKNFISSS
ncbi:uncharacterized protein LOC127582161 [Pristis pectinata]|uniref:uncharacterized protein LOC127582161 n=1 Tax=Pristis pectinata TaxID=685728 RepID=UPI00223C9C42|nr:uncharacterized protein LOC127582161 [Pristis pectinata]